MYVSTLVFGEASKFLLPWKRVFKVSDAQVDVAVRDNASRLFNAELSKVDKGKLLQLFILLLRCNTSGTQTCQKMTCFAEVGTHKRYEFLLCEYLVGHLYEVTGFLTHSYLLLGWSSKVYSMTQMSESPGT